MAERAPSGLSRLVRHWANAAWRLGFGPRMLYGWRAADGAWLAHTRICRSTRVEAPARLDIGDHVYIGPFNLVDASGGLVIGEGVQVTSHCALLTHSSHASLRIAGRRYWGDADPPAFRRAATHIGAYSFIGAHSVVMPGSRIGRGVIVRAFSYVDGDVPDFAIVGGQPAAIIGDARSLDAAWLSQHPEDRPAYEAWLADATAIRPR